MKLIVTHSYFAKNRDELLDFVKDEKDIILVNDTGNVKNYKIVDNGTVEALGKWYNEAVETIEKIFPTIEETEDSGMVYRKEFHIPNPPL